MRLSLRYSGVMTTILLTGSSRGIGAAAKASLEARGAKVIGQATSSKAVDTVPADFCEPGAPHELWEAALARTGGEIDVLINNAGLFDPNPLDRSDIEWLDAWEDTMRINLTASAQLSRFAVRHWQERDFPRQYAHQGILSFAITPGFTDTAMAGDYLESRGGVGLLADIPLGRVAEPEEMARIITFCALDAPASMTGATLDANGASYVR